MMPPWVMEQLANERRRELDDRVRAYDRMGLFRQGTADAAPVVAAVPTVRRTADRQPAVHRVGAWLIRAGTRLGGTSISTS